jgi:hypothetical protein
MTFKLAWCATRRFKKSNLYSFVSLCLGVGGRQRKDKLGSHGTWLTSHIRLLNVCELQT